jgi:hypothetical protein
MDDLTAVREQLNHHLREATAADPLQALTAIDAVQHDVADHQRTAVRAAARKHSWNEIGDALGVSKQAAHQKFAKEWASELKEELKAEARTFKQARKAGAKKDATAAKAKLDAVIDEFKTAGRKND